MGGGRLSSTRARRPFTGFIWGIVEDVFSVAKGPLRVFSLGCGARTVQGGGLTRRIWVPLAAVGILALSGCSSAVTLDPAPDAANPDCAKAMVAMPDTLAGQSQRETTAQATTAYGDPASIIVKCGARVKEPVMDPCVRVNGVDWTIRKDDAQDSSASQGPSSDPSATAGSAKGQASTGQAADGQTFDGTGTWTATSFGRSPAVQVTFDAGKVNSSTILVDLQSSVNRIHQTKQCSSVSDNLDYSGNS